MRINIKIQGEKLSLFKDENININRSVADIRNINKNTTEYINTFTTPANDVNNLIFKHYYNADIDNGFDARIKVDATIEIDGFVFAIGKIRLSKVTLKKNVPFTYHITFWGNLVNLKDLFKNDLISDLPLTQFNHPYEYAEVFAGLTEDPATRDFVYTLTPKRQYYYNSENSDHTNNESLVNIAANGGTNGIAWNELVPSLKVFRIIEAIEVKYGIQFSDDFFHSDAFKEAFLLLNKAVDVPVGITELDIKFNRGDDKFINFDTGVGTYDAYWYYDSWTKRRQVRNYKVTFQMRPQPGYETVPYIFRTFREAVKVNEFARTGDFDTTYDANNAGQTTFTHRLSYQVEADEDLLFDVIVNVEEYWFDTYANPDTVITNYSTFADNQFINNSIQIKTSIPEIKVVDFLRGLFNTFKLVVIPRTATDIYVDNITNYYKTGQIVDITNYIDYEQYTIERGEVFKEIDFKFEEPKTVLNLQFKKNNAKYYGDAFQEIFDDKGEVLDGDSLTVEVPWETILFERLTDIEDDALTSVQYGALLDDKLEPTDTAPVLHYVARADQTAKPIVIIDDTDSKVSYSGNLNTITSSDTLEDSTKTLLFSNELSPWNRTEMPFSLFQLYFADFVSGVYNAKRRNYNYSANLPVGVLLKLNLNDVLKIKGRLFRIDNYRLNLLTGKVDFKLFNVFSSGIPFTDN